MARIGVVLKSLIALLVVAQVNCVYDGTVCYVDNSDFDTSAVFTLSPNYDPEFLTPSSCSEGCVEAGPEYIIVGITNNKTCLCGKSGTDLVAVDRSNCWMNCSDDSPCGGYSGFFSVYEPASSVPKDISFDLMLDDPVAPTFVKVTNINLHGATALLYVQPAEDAPPSQVGTGPVTTQADILLPIAVYLPGKHRVSLTLTNPEGTVAVSSSQWIEIEDKPLPLQVSCPIVAEPGLPYRCSFASIPGVGNLTAEYILPDTSVAHSYTFEPPDSDVTVLGHLPPITMSTLNVDLAPMTPNLALTPTIFGNGWSESTAHIVLVQWFSSVASSTAVSLHIYDASCSLAAGGKYDPTSGYCEDPLAGPELGLNLGLGYEHVCQASDFNTLFRSCMEETCSAREAMCASENVRAVPDTFTEVSAHPITGGTYASSNGHYFAKLTVPIVLQPGQFVGISGQKIGYRVRTAGDSEAEDFSPVGRAGTGNIYYASVTAIKPEFLGFEANCSEANIIQAGVLSSLDDLMTVSNFTTCQDPIEGFENSIVAGTTVQNPDWSPELYIKVGESMALEIYTSRGLPINVTIDWDDGNIEEDRKLVEEDATRNMSYPHVYIDHGSYNLNVTLENLHSDPDYGHVGEIHNNNTWIVNVEYEVINLDDSLIVDFWLKDHETDWPVDFLLVLPDTTPNPTHPKSNCSWGNGIEEDFQLIPPHEVVGASSHYHLLYNGYDAGEYTASCTVFNNVSSQSFTKNFTVYEKIVDFVVPLMFIPRGSTELAPGLGPANVQFPLDRNVTLTFDYTTGTIEKILVRNVSFGVDEDLGTFMVPDKFDAKSFTIDIPFEVEGFANFTIQPWSEVEQTLVPYFVSFEVVGQVRGIALDDSGIVTSKDEVKLINVTFDSVGAGTCLEVDFKDGYIIAIGDEAFCKFWSRTANRPYVPGYEITSPMILDHVYYDFGMYNVTVYASNVVTYVETWDDLMVIVSGAPCRHPEVSIPSASIINVAPIPYMMSEAITVDTNTKVNCSGVLTTKKTWEIYIAQVNTSTFDEELSLLPIAFVAPDTMNDASLIIPSRGLTYGIYKLRFYARMWDESDEDPMWTRKLPFERDAFTYIEIQPSPLVAKLIDATANLVTRGKGQIMQLDPELYSYDPDYPELEATGLEFRWFCRAMTSADSGEAYPVDPDTGERLYDPDNLISIPETGTPDDISGGCFGTGPGAINVTEGTAALRTINFVSSDNALYEILVEVRKDTFDYRPDYVRVATKFLHLLVVPGIPPLMDIKCASAALCFDNGEDKTFVNPSSRLALRAECSLDEGSDCQDPMSYYWRLTTPEGVDLNVEPEMSTTGLNAVDMAVSPEFFAQYPSQTRIHVTLTATNGNDVDGTVSLYIYINFPPVGINGAEKGTCEVTPSYGVAMVDIFFISCSDWTDPEGIDISSYRVLSRKDGTDSALMSKNSLDPANKEELNLGNGVHNLVVEVKDEWGAVTEFVIPSPVVVNVISTPAFVEFMASGKLDEIAASGDQGAMLMALQAQAAVLADSDETLQGDQSMVPGVSADQVLTEQELADQKASVKGQLKIDSLDRIIDNGGGVITQLATAEILSETVSALIGEPPIEGEPGTVGLEAAKKTTIILEELVNSLQGIKGIAEPKAIVPTMESMTRTIGTLMDGIMTTSSIQAGSDTTAEEICSQLVPIDVVSADKPGVVEYDTDIGDDIEMKVPTDPAAQRCNGIIDAAKLVGDDIGPRLLDMLSTMSMTLLSKSVVGEATLIETDKINLYAKMTPGHQMGDKHILGSSANSPWIKFPDDFCLGPLKNSSCDTPAGVSAVVYESNPRGSLPSSPRLSYDTVVIEVTVSDAKKNTVVDVQKVYEKDGSEGIQFYIPRTNKSREGLPAPIFYNTTERFQYYSENKVQLMYHLMEVVSIHVDSALNIEFYPEDFSVKMVILLDHDRIPTYKSFSFGVNVKNYNDKLKSGYMTAINEGFDWFVINEAVNNRTGRWMITVAQVTEEIPQEQLDMGYFGKDKLTAFTKAYSLRTFHSGCYYFNRAQYAWVADGVKVLENQYSSTTCKASHLTSFGSGFFNKPNTIDFDFIFAEASFEDNLTIYLTIIISLILWLSLSIWAFLHDKDDKKKLRSLPLPDNRPNDHYLYEILTFTGHWDGSSCDSGVYIVLTGDEGDTGKRLLDEGRKDTLRKGTIDSYIMKSPRPLGNLSYLRLWTDSTGRDHYGSWHCSAVIVIDVQTGQRYEFILNKWLAPEKDDGEVERLVQVAGYAEKSSCKHLIVHTAGKHIKENHLWFSIFFRSARSRFTRLQRVQCAFALLFLSMVADGMWYDTNEEQITGEGLELGVVTLNVDQVVTACLVAAITIFPAFLLMFLFKTSRPWKKRPNRIDRALRTHQSDIDSGLETKNESSSEDSSSSSSSSSSSEESDEEDKKSTTKSNGSARSKKSNKSGSSSSDGSSDSSSSSSNSSSSDDESSESGSGSGSGSDSDKESRPGTSKSIKSRKSRKSLKSAAAAAPVIQPVMPVQQPDPYDQTTTTILSMDNRGQEEGETKNFTLPSICNIIAWVLCFICILGGAFLTFSYGLHFGNDKTYQWLSSLLVAIFINMLIIDPIKVALISCLLSTCCKNLDLVADDVEDDEEEPTLAEESQWYGSDYGRIPAPKHPVDEGKLEHLRAKREHEIEMWAIVKELVGFFLFIVIVFIISYLNRDPASFRFQNQLRHNFVIKNKFDQIKSTNDWWAWIHKTAVSELKAGPLYNGQPPYGLRGFIGDHASRVMGYGTLRQVRVKPNTCRVHKSVVNLTQECAQGSALINEDHDDYCNAWEEQTPLTRFLPSCSRSEFKYTTAGDLNSQPYNAKIDLYGGGGFVYHIKGSSKSITEGLEILQKNKWVNNHTRAVFLEFSVYNANLNLFGISTLVAEFIPGGGIMPYWRIDPVRLLHHHESIGSFILLCEIIFIFYILYFTYKFVRDVIDQGCDFFSTYWALADVAIIFAAFAAFGLYGYRYFLTREILDKFVETKGNGYMKLQYVGTIDEYYGYLIGFILFVANIKLIKLLRFNNRFSQLILTLRTCWDDLSGFLAIFFLVFFAFVQLFYMILHTNMEEFHTIIAALETCFTMMLNKFKFGNMKETSMTAAIMFFFFAVSCTWILINVLLTIIIEAFEKVKEELNARGNEYEILDFIKTHAHYVAGSKELPPKFSVLADDQSDSDKDGDGITDTDESDLDDHVGQLPGKIDTFLVYINDTYFDGNLEMDNKAILKQELVMRKPVTPEERQKSAPKARLIYNSSDQVSKSPRRRRNIFNSNE